MPRAGPGGTEPGSGAGTELPPAPPVPTPSPPPPSSQPPGHGVPRLWGAARGAPPSLPSVSVSGTRPCWEPLAAPRGAGSGLAAGCGGKVLCLRPARERCSKELHACTNTEMPSGPGGGCLFPRLLISLCSSLASAARSLGSCRVLSALEPHDSAGLGRVPWGKGPGRQISPGGRFSVGSEPGQCSPSTLCGVGLWPSPFRGTLGRVWGVQYQQDEGLRLLRATPRGCSAPFSPLLATERF